MQIEIIERKEISKCPSGHQSFYWVSEAGKDYCMVCFALGFARELQRDKIKHLIVNTEFGKQIRPT